MNISELSEIIQNFLLNLGFLGGVLGIGLIVVESILPCLPLALFITMVFITFGSFGGFIMCWLATVLGCYLSFMICNKWLKTWIEKKIKKTKYAKKVDMLMNDMGTMSIASLSMMVAIPFTPAFAVNIAAGLSDMSPKKFLISMIIGKAFMVYFWGYVGVNLIECFTHPIYLVKIVIMVAVAYIISKIVNKYLKID